MIGWDIIFGGITGLVGSLMTGVMNYKTQKMANEHKERMVALESEAMREEAKMNIAITKAEVEGAVELADAQSYLQSQKDANKPLFTEQWIEKLFKVEGWLSYVATPFAVLIAIAFAFVDFLRGFMRPGITLYLTGMTTVITWMAWDIMKTHGMETLSVAEAIGLYEQVTSIVIYLTVSCVTWWFSDRRTAKFIQNMNNKGNGNMEGI